MTKPFIRIENLEKNYTTKKALQGVSLTINEGEILGLLGVNGAGKTTLSTLIAGIHPASAGSIMHNGTSIYENLVAYKKLIGYCPQKPNLDASLTLEENLLFSGSYYGIQAHDIKSRVKHLMDQFNLHEYAKSQAAILSGGYKQRFLLARALIHQPKLLILDEPTVGLDPDVRRNLWELILTLKKQGTTILLTTHYIEEADQISDRVCILDAGVIKVIDTPANLKAIHGMNNLEDVFLTLIGKK